MNNKLLLILRLIQKQADTSYLTRQGLSYSQIAAIFGEALNQGLVEYEEANFRVTPEGERMLKENSILASGDKQGKWISADESFIAPQIDVNDVYLPKIKDTQFF